MKSIKEDTKKEIIIKKSRFICHLYRVNDVNQIKEKINYIRNKYKDATHNCYAYICGTMKKMSDDGEPSGTAGMPILGILETNELNNTLAIVTRYFGGIKLGANGLVRAYAESVIETLNQTEIINLIKGSKIKIKFNYDHIKQIDYLLKDYLIINKEYKNNVIYTLNIPFNSDIINKLSKYLISYQELEETYITQLN